MGTAVSKTLAEVFRVMKSLQRYCNCRVAKYFEILTDQEQRLCGPRRTHRANVGIRSKTNMSHDITLNGPDDAELRIFPHAEFYLWRIRNNGLGRFENVQLRVD